MDWRAAPPVFMFRFRVAISRLGWGYSFQMGFESRKGCLEEAVDSGAGGAGFGGFFFLGDALC